MKLPTVFSQAYRVIAKFVKANAENKELLVGHLIDLLPTYGAMFQVALYCQEESILRTFHDSFVDMYLAIFANNEYIVYASKPIH